MQTSIAKGPFILYCSSFVTTLIIKRFNKLVGDKVIYCIAENFQDRYTCTNFAKFRGLRATHEVSLGTYDWLQAICESFSLRNFHFHESFLYVITGTRNCHSKYHSSVDVFSWTCCGVGCIVSMLMIDAHFYYWWTHWMKVVVLGEGCH